jgi:hypothetical protein
MPFLSEQQRKAMGAALSGHSNLGIPKEVAEKFFAHDMAPMLAPNAAIPAGVRRLARDAVEGLDMSDEDWRGLIDGLIKFFGEESQEAEHANDSELIALDKDSVRNIDKSGRMHVELANICKACVSPYRGSEVPNWEELKLEPDKIYQLLRDPKELEKATPSANGIQILRKHIPVTADDHQPWDVIGAVGTNAKWRDPYIQNGLTLWPTADIGDVSSGKKKNLSPGYSYTADMTPGTFDGVAYDGVMRNISFNHLATVEDGRQGDDVSIGDSAIELQWAAIERAVVGMVA